MMGSSEPEDISAYHERINWIEEMINSLSVPLSFFSEVYRLKEHVDLVRGKLVRLSNQSKEGNPEN
jgi:hypothetical protein